jgi:Tfp pilus assembly protein PilE
VLERLRKRLHGDEKGYALIGLLVVIVIFGIVVAIATGSYLNFRIKASKSAAAADLSALIPSIKAYHLDNGTYVGMTPASLQAAYDHAIKPHVYTLTSLTASTYCAKATVNGATAYKSGPSAAVRTTGKACT